MTHKTIWWYHARMSTVWYIVGWLCLAYVAFLLLMACRGLIRGTRKMFDDIRRDKAGQFCPKCGRQGVISGMSPEYQSAEYKCLGGHVWGSFRIIPTGTLTGFGVDSYAP